MESTNLIKLPPYNWFINKSDNKPVCNIFSGSCDTDAGRGCTNKTTFNYKVHVEDVGTENARFVAECFYVKPLTEGGKKEAIASTESACSDEGLLELDDWLNAEHEKFLSSVGTGE